MSTGFTGGLESEILIIIIESANCYQFLNATKSIKSLRRALEHFGVGILGVDKESKKPERNKGFLGKVL